MNALKSNDINDWELHALLGINNESALAIVMVDKYEQKEKPEGTDWFSIIDRKLEWTSTINKYFLKQLLDEEIDEEETYFKAPSSETFWQFGISIQK